MEENIGKWEGVNITLIEFIKKMYVNVGVVVILKPKVTVLIMSFELSSFF